MEKTLKQVHAHAVYSSDNERGGSIRGYYKDYNIAAVKAKGSGYYGSDGEVKDAQLWQDEEGVLYELKKVGLFADEAEKYREETLSSIKAKLTKEELKLLGIE